MEKMLIARLLKIAYEILITNDGEDDEIIYQQDDEIVYNECE